MGQAVHLTCMSLDCRGKKEWDGNHLNPPWQSALGFSSYNLFHIAHFRKSVGYHLESTVFVRARNLFFNHQSFQELYQLTERDQTQRSIWRVTQQIIIEASLIDLFWPLVTCKQNTDMLWPYEVIMANMLANLHSQKWTSNISWNSVHSASCSDLISTNPLSRSSTALSG